MDDWEYSDFWCPGCGEQLHRQECPSCGGEGYHYGEDLVEEDPLWYSEDDIIRCADCHGRGHHIWCGNTECRATREEILASVNEQIAEYEVNHD